MKTDPSPGLSMGPIALRFLGAALRSIGQALDLTRERELRRRPEERSAGEAVLEYSAQHVKHAHEMLSEQFGPELAPQAWETLLNERAEILQTVVALRSLSSMLPLFLDAVEEHLSNVHAAAAAAAASTMHAELRHLVERSR